MAATLKCDALQHPSSTSANITMSSSATNFGTIEVTIGGGTVSGVTMSGSDVTVGSGKSLNVANGTLTTSSAQKLAIMQGPAANVDIGAYEMRAQTFESDVATGTAPLVVASTTKVTNLNADLFDDLSSASFVRSDAVDTINENITFSSATLTSDSDITTTADMGCQDIAISETIALNTNKFTVSSAGAGVFASTLQTAGALTVTNGNITSGGTTTVSLQVGGSTKASVNNAGMLSTTNLTLTSSSAMVVASTTMVDNLNADLLDDLEAASFMRSDTTATTSGSLTTAGNLTVTNGVFVSGNNHMLFNPNGTTKMKLETDGDLVVAGDITAFGSPSDENMKKNIALLSTADSVMADLARLEVKTFQYKPDYIDHATKEGTQIGIIAQDLENLFPEAVQTKDDGMKAINYDMVICLMLRGMQEIWDSGTPGKLSFAAPSVTVSEG